VVTKYFWVYSDGKKVKELSFQEYFKVGLKRKSLVASINEHSLVLWKKDKVLWISMPQLKQILKSIENDGES